MRTDLQLIQSAVATSELDESRVEKIDEDKYKFINLYHVHLPDRFKGLPSYWNFGVLPDGNSPENKNAIIREAREIINSIKPDNDCPFVLISDDQLIHFGVELAYRESPVFFLDKFELPGRESFPPNARAAPIMLSARRKFKNSEASYHLSPYSPNKPVSDWRFFGRKKELRKIIESRSNFFVLGARRIGKTSLLQEVKNILRDQNETVYWVSCQYKENIHEIINEIANFLPTRDLNQALYAKKTWDINFLVTILRKLKADKKNITLICDEIGNTISKDVESESWRFVGAIRELSHNNDIRFIFSAFQETIIKQLANYEGPFVNFGGTIKLYPFTKNEIEEILIYPLGFWGKIRDKRELGNYIKKHFGSHPLILQFLGQKLFSSIVKNEEKFVDDVIRDFDTDDSLKYFQDAVTDLFGKIDYLERYVFLRLCMDNDKGDSGFGGTEIRQSNIREILEKIGIESELDTRELLLERLTMRGLLSQDMNDESVFRIDCVIIYTYLKRFKNPKILIMNYLDEIKMPELDISQLKW